MMHEVYNNFDFDSFGDIIHTYIRGSTQQHGLNGNTCLSGINQGGSVSKDSV